MNFVWIFNFLLETGSSFLNKGQISWKHLVKCIFIEGREDRDIPKFMTVTKRTGRIAHRYVDSQYVYRRSKVDRDGRAHFVCIVRGCPVKLHAKYKSKVVSCGDQEPVITS